MIWLSHSSQLYVDEDYSFVYIFVKQQSDMKRVNVRSGSLSTVLRISHQNKRIIVGLLSFISILQLDLFFFVPVNKCKYICIYGKIPFEDVHKSTGHFWATTAHGREAK